MVGHPWHWVLSVLHSLLSTERCGCHGTSSMWWTHWSWRRWALTPLSVTVITITEAPLWTVCLTLTDEAFIELATNIITWLPCGAGWHAQLQCSVFPDVYTIWLRRWLMNSLFHTQWVDASVTNTHVCVWLFSGGEWHPELWPEWFHQTQSCHCCFSSVYVLQKFTWGRPYHTWNTGDKYYKGHAYKIFHYFVMESH